MCRKFNNRYFENNINRHHLAERRSVGAGISTAQFKEKLASKPDPIYAYVDRIGRSAETSKTSFKRLFR